MLCSATLISWPTTNNCASINCEFVVLWTVKIDKEWNVFPPTPVIVSVCRGNNCIAVHLENGAITGYQSKNFNILVKL